MSERFVYRPEHSLYGPNIIDRNTGRVWGMELCREFVDVFNAATAHPAADIGALVDKFKAAARAKPTALNGYGLLVWNDLKKDLCSLFTAQPAAPAVVRLPASYTSSTMTTRADGSASVNFQFSDSVAAEAWHDTVIGVQTPPEGEQR